MDVAPILAGLVLFVASLLVGIPSVAKIITIYEAKHELRQGSAGWLRSISGWSLVLIWLLVTWFLATIVGDWYVSGDLDGALDRSEVRLRVMIEVIIALSSSD